MQKKLESRICRKRAKVTVIFWGRQNVNLGFIQAFKYSISFQFFIFFPRLAQVSSKTREGNGVGTAEFIIFPPP